MLDVLLRRKSLVRLAPAETLEIPVCFTAPDFFVNLDAYVTVQISKASQKPWIYNEKTGKPDHFTGKEQSFSEILKSTVWISRGFSADRNSRVIL